MEEERVRGLAEASAREAAEAERQVREQQARLTAERVARERAEEEARREAERRAHEVAARLEALRRAAMEAARFEAEARVKAEERERERRLAVEVEHARAVAESRPRGVVWGLSAGLVVAAVAAGLHFGVVVPKNEAALRSATAQGVEKDAAVAGLSSRVDAAEEHARSLDADLTAARAEIARLQGLLAARPPTPGPRGGPGGPTHGPPRGSDPRLDGFTTCPPGSKDPMCLR